MADGIILEGVGARIRGERLKRLWTIAELATRAKLSRERVGQWEREHNTPSLLTIHKLASAFDCDPAYLAYGTTSPTGGFRNAPNTSGVGYRTLCEPGSGENPEDTPKGTN